jgi:transcription antitermination factor NusG
VSNWVVLELTSQGEDEDPEILRSALLRSFKGADLFIPASISIVGDSRVVHKLIDNYVFIRKELPDSSYFKVEGSKYISTVLSTNTVGVRNGGTRKTLTIRDADISKMRRQIEVETEQGIEVGDDVEVMSGAYKGIRGRVIEEIPENASVQVYILLRSKEAIVTLPRSFLRFVVKDAESDVPTFAPFLTRITRLREWARRATTILSVAVPQPTKLKRLFNRWRKMRPLVTKLGMLEPYLEVGDKVELEILPSSDELESLRKRFVLLSRTHRVAWFVSTVEKMKPLSSTKSLSSTFERYALLSDFTGSYFRLSRQVQVAGEITGLEEIPDVSEFGELLATGKDLHGYHEKGKVLKFAIDRLEAKIRKLESVPAKKKKAKKHAAVKRRR